MSNECETSHKCEISQSLRSCRNDKEYENIQHQQ